MATWHVVDAPAVCLGLLPALVEVDARKRRRADERLFRDALARARQSQLLGETLDRMRRAHLVDPPGVLVVDMEERGRTRRHPDIAFGFGGLECFTRRRRLHVDQRLAAVAVKRVE